MDALEKYNKIKKELAQIENELLENGYVRMKDGTFKKSECIWLAEVYSYYRTEYESKGYTELRRFIVPIDDKVLSDIEENINSEEKLKEYMEEELFDIFSKELIDEELKCVGAYTYIDDGYDSPDEDGAYLVKFQLASMHYENATEGEINIFKGNLKEVQKRYPDVDLALENTCRYN